MAKVDYDPFEGHYRMAAVLEDRDPRMASILACHIALEREIMAVLERTVPRSGFLRDLSFSNKIDVLAATWAGTDDHATKVRDVLRAFNALRNRIAHGNDEKVGAAISHLQSAHHALYPGTEHDADPEEIAGSIISFFGDGPTPREVRELTNGLEHLLKSWSATFGDPGKPAPEG